MSPRSTDLIHHPYEAPDGFLSVVPAVHKASTVIFADTRSLQTTQWKDKSGYTYGLHGTPTTFVLEERLATLEGGAQCLLAPSGLSALALVNQSLLKAGDQVLLPDNAYAPNKDFVRGELARWGISHAHYDPSNPDDLAARITPAGGGRLGHAGVPGSGRLVESVPSACTGHQRAGQHLGCWSGLRCLRSGLARVARLTWCGPHGPRADQVPLWWRRCVDGLGGDP
jgi:Cys/Met metabolism PLP-dependent enzyme